MSTQQLRAATQAAKEPKTFMQLIETMKPEIARALPRHLNPDRMARIAVTEFRKNPKLGDCDMQSLFGAIITLSQLGLEPGVLGQGYLIPYKGKCQGVPGWQGLADLVARAGRASVWTGAVYSGHEFDYAYGDRPYITHKPNDDEELIENLTHCYAVGRIKGADVPVVEVWSAKKIAKHRDRYNKVGTMHYSFAHFEMYGRKVPLLQVIKYMPKSVELQQALDLENAAAAGVTIDMQQAKDGWVPPSEPEGSETGAGVNKETGETGAPAGGSYQALYDTKSAVEKIRTAETQEQLAGIFAAIAADYTASKRDLPVDVEGAYGDRKALIDSKK